MVEVSSGATHEVEPSAASARAPAGWDGSESPWVVAAMAAAPWPLWSIALAIGAPGASHVPRWAHGALALALVFGLMVVWVRRPPMRTVFGQWLPSVLGTGLMLELLANALTDMGRGRGLAALDDPARVLATALVCVCLYEVGPIIASACRVTSSEHRARSLDVVAYLAFGLCALAAHEWAPRSAEGWYLSPWIAAIVALPLATVRSVPRRLASLPATAPRGRALAGLAIVAWLILAVIFIGASSELGESARRTWRWGTDPLEGALWALPALSLLLSTVAALTLVARAVRIGGAPSGRVTAVGDGGVTLERAGEEEPAWVAIEAGELPSEGATVTLLGVRTRPADSGPFRDGAPTLCARRAWSGTPDMLARALVQRAAGWLAWAAAGALGLWLRMI